MLADLRADGWTSNPPRQWDTEAIDLDVVKDGYAVSVGATRQGRVRLVGRSSCYAEDGTVSFHQKAGQ